MAAYTACGGASLEPKGEAVAGEGWKAERVDQRMLAGSALGRTLAASPVLNEPILNRPELKLPAGITFDTAPVTCDELIPRLPFKPQYFTTPAGTGACLSGTTDWNGNFYFLKEDSSYDHLDVVDMISSGIASEVGPGGLQFQCPECGFAPIANGLLVGGLANWPSPSPLKIIRPTGQIEEAYPPPNGVPEATVHPRPNGGAVAAVNGQLLAIDAEGRPNWSWSFPARARDYVYSIGVDTNGYTLLLSWFEDCGSSANCSVQSTYGLKGQWLDPSGVAQPEFVILSGLPSGFETPHLLSTPRVNGGFFLYTPPTPQYGQNLWPKPDTWALQVDEGSTVLRPAPSWLANQPVNTAIHLIHGNMAYVLSTLEVVPGGCHHKMTTATDKGEICSSIETDIAGGDCASWFVGRGYTGNISSAVAGRSGLFSSTVPDDPSQRLVDIGADGTLFESYPTYTSNGLVPTCTWRYWPQLFK